MEPLPSALKNWNEIRDYLKDKQLVVFLDYDGTLTPIVESPAQAVLSEAVRNTVRQLAQNYPVTIVSGRDLQDVRKLVNIEGIFYAGSHGFDISDPAGKRDFQIGSDFLPVLDQAEAELRSRLEKIAGVFLERKKFSIAVHYRKVAEADLVAVRDAVDQVLQRHPDLRQPAGKRVFELQPKIDWHKGRAVLKLLEVLSHDPAHTLPIYIGDDLTDEDAFQSLKNRGLGIAVQSSPRSTAAQYTLRDPTEVLHFLQNLVSLSAKNIP